MAGTDTSIQQIPDNTPLPPVVILVRPQLGENIGMCARAMLNCGVTELRLVAPRDGWPNPDAEASASGACILFETAKVYATTAEAVADLDFVLATTARDRYMVKGVMTAEEAGKEIHKRHTGITTPTCGILFGPERSGLENDDVAVADMILNIPLNPGFSSLNLAQAVLLTCYSWLSAQNPFSGTAFPPAQDGDENESPATKGEVENLMQRLEEELEKRRFFRSPEQRPTLLRNIRNFFFRGGMTKQEARTFHGMISALIEKRRPE